MAATAADTPPDPQPFEGLLSGIASSFIDAPLDRFGDVIGDALRRIVLALDLDRATLSDAHPRLNEARIIRSWARLEQAQISPGPTAIEFPWTAARMRRGVPAVFSKLSELPPEAAVDAAGFAKLGIRSHVSMPVRVTGEFVALLSFGTLQTERDWPAPLLARLRLLGDLFGSFLARKLAKDRIDAQLRFERMLVDVSTSLASAGGARADEELQRAMEAAAGFLRVDRMRIYRFDADLRRLCMAREWQARDPRAEPIVVKVDERRVLRELLEGKVVRRGANANAGGELLAIPLFAGAGVVGALSLARAAAADGWPDEFLPRLEVFGHKMAAAIARCAAEESARRAILEAAEHRERLAHLARVEAVGAMSAAIAHEINQPLAAIRNYALAAQRRLDGDGRVDRARLEALLDKIADQAGAASAVLDRIRAMVKRGPSCESPVAVGALFANAVRLIELEARRRQVRVQRRVAPRLPAVLGDEIQVQQVLLNLAHNAIEAMSTVPSGHRTLRLAAAPAPGGRIRLEVSDTGPGVPAAEAEHIFEPFHTTRAEGLGMGLAICRAIVEAHGGELWHEPRRGGGSSFRFTLQAVSPGR